MAGGTRQTCTSNDNTELFTGDTTIEFRSKALAEAIKKSVDMAVWPLL